MPEAVFACRDVRLLEPSVEEQRQTIVRRLGFTPRSHTEEWSSAARAEQLDEAADTMEREIRILRREPVRAPVSERTRRILELQIEHLLEEVRRHRVAARQLRRGDVPPSPKRRKR